MNIGADMGVDVGTHLHVVVRSHADGEGRTRALFIGEVEHFSDLDDLIGRYGVRRSVIDALPEGHGAREFARRRSSVCLSYYDHEHGDHAWERADAAGVRIVHVNRTLALEAMFQRFHDGKAELPRDARRLGGRVRDGFGEYYREMMALTRVLDENARGDWVSRYINGRKADHYAHAETYCLLAGQSDRGGRILTIRSF